MKFKNWLDEWTGSLLCDCDLGCRQWIEKNSVKAYLIIRALNSGYRRENIEKIASMSEDRSKKIFYKIWKMEVSYQRRQSRQY